MIRFFVLFLVWFSAQVLADVYIDCRCTFNGNGTASHCAASGGAAGALNSPVTNITTPGETYLYARDSVCTLASAAIIVDEDNVTITASGIGARPIIDGGGAAYTMYITSTDGCAVNELDLRSGSSGALSINNVSDGCVISDLDITSDAIGFVASNAGLQNLTLRDLDITCNGSTSICTNVATNGGGVTFSDSTITLTADDRSASSLIGLRLNGTATNVDGVTITGGYIGLEIRNTDGHHLNEMIVSGAAEAGFRLRDTSDSVIQAAHIFDIWDGLPYPSGAGAAVSILDVSDACGNNTVRASTIHDVYQGVLDQCDVEAGNLYYANLLYDYRVNGISYQADGQPGTIALNTLWHDPAESVGHAIAVQLETIATSATIVNNHCTLMQVGSNIQCIAIPASADTGPIYLDFNSYDVRVIGGYYGKLDNTNYDSLSAWQTALQGDADTSGDEANAFDGSPGFWDEDQRDFRLRSNSPLRGAGGCYLPIGCAHPDHRGIRSRVPPDIGAFQRQ